MEVSALQIEQLVNISGFDNNFRNPQPLFGRIVSIGSDNKWLYPYEAAT